VAYGTAAWVLERPNAYCSGDDTYFRWERKYTGSELNAHVGKQHRIGPVTDIILGERAPGGRLKSITIEGRDDSVTIRKELPIRLAFGGLPSAMFTVDFERSPEGLRSVIFRGGGRGHGVGMCQQGARGMALQGKGYVDILRHYFTGVTIERVGSR
jgi:SpoIID/LytB domain protein